MNHEYIKADEFQYQMVPLPGDIARVIAAGHYEEAREMIAVRMENPRVSDILKKRMKVELEMLTHIEARFTVTPEQGVMLMLEKGVSDFTLEELEMLRRSSVVDWRYVDGEIRYLDTFADTLCRIEAEYRNRMEEIPPEEPNPVDDILKSIYDGMEMKAHIHIRHQIDFDPAKIEAGKTLRIYLPIPKDEINAQMKNIQILATSHTPAAMAEGDTLQPTIFFKETAATDLSVWVEYAFDHELVYHDMSKADPAVCESGVIPADVLMYLEEKTPHITFTPYLRALAAEIVGNEKNLLKKARRIYDYVTTQVTYRFAPDYASIDCVPEYCALNGYGDCGIQALLFITLCRIAGIPAKWQSGICARPQDIGEHDWSQFYIPGMGWLFADLSMGGHAFRLGKTDRWNFYFGNIDPYRIPVNEDVCEELIPEMKFARRDPTDNQAGEAEYEDAPCPWDTYERTFVDLGIH